MPPSRARQRAALLLAVLSTLAPLLLSSPTPARAATLPDGFEDALVAGVIAPTALAFTPDGRLLIASQRGRLYVAREGETPRLALTLPNICAVWERGLLGVAVDPDFADNRRIYLYYTRTIPGSACSPGVPAANRVARFTLLDDNTAIDETVVIDNIATPLGNHNGGDLQFGRDGYLYISVGEGGMPEEARRYNTLSGKILRVAPDGTVPPTNPFVGAGSVPCAATGETTPDKVCAEIYALGLRNPFRLAFDPNADGTRFFINDVGQDTWEEIDQGAAGADYGWHLREGHCAAGSTTACAPPPVGITNPIYDYGRATGCSSITGGAFVPDGVWPAGYGGGYLFGDYTCGKLFLLQQGGGAWSASVFASGLGESSAVHLGFGPYCGTQALYYTSYAEGGQVRRIAHNPPANCPPSAVITAAPANGPAPLAVSFGGAGSSDPNAGDTLSYLWDFGDGGTALTGGPAVAHTYATGGTYTATLRVRDGGGLLSTPATILIGVGNTPPVPTIVAPPAGAFYVTGREYRLVGGATDAEDGVLAGDRLSWTVILHHNAHTHPFLGPVGGESATFTAPTHEEGAIWLEVRLTATDAQGLSATASIPLYHFTDVPADHPAYRASEELAAAGVIKGYGAGGCAARSLIAPCFVPGDASLRAQMAALIVRAMGWSGEQAANPFTDDGGIDAELWRSVAILASRGVAQGYGGGRFGPNDDVSQAQVVSFVVRAMVARGDWELAAVDDPAVYPNVPASTGHRIDLVTFVQRVGALPDYPADAPWEGWSDPATRGWFARVLWQALLRDE